MKQKFTVVIAITLMGVCSSVLADTVSADITLQQEIALLKKALAKVDRQVSASTIQAPSLSIAPYIGVTPAFNGSNLIVYDFDTNNDFWLLQLRQAEINAYQQANQIYPDTLRLIFSGNIEGTANYTTAYPGTPAGTNVNVTNAELDTLVEANRWVSGFMAWTYNDSNGDQANRVNNSE